MILNYLVGTAALKHSINSRVIVEIIDLQYIIFFC